MITSICCDVFRSTETYANAIWISVMLYGHVSDELLPSPLFNSPYSFCMDESCPITAFSMARMTCGLVNRLVMM